MKYGMTFSKYNELLLISEPGNHYLCHKLFYQCVPNWNTEIQYGEVKLFHLKGVSWKYQKSYTEYFFELSTMFKNPMQTKYFQDIRLTVFKCPSDGFETLEILLNSLRDISFLFNIFGQGGERNRWLRPPPLA